MKLPLNELQPNPFKKEINKGKMNEETIKKLISNLDKLDLMGAIPVVKRDGKYCLVSHHHRVEALKRKFGKKHEVEVVVHKYDDDQLLRGMVIENLTQRNDEFHEVTDNLLAIESYLNKNPKILASLRESRSHPEKMKEEYKDKAVAKDIAKWIDNNSGDVMSHDKITNCLNIKKNLDPELYNQIKNTQAGTAEEREDALQETQAVYLSRIEDKEEQKDLAVALKGATEQRVRNQGKLISEYKKSPEEIKKKVREGSLKLDDVPIENIKTKIKERIEFDHKEGLMQSSYKEYQTEAGARVSDANKNIVQACIFLDELDKKGLITELDWKTMMMIINAGTEYGENYVKFLKKIKESCVK